MEEKPASAEETIETPAIEQPPIEPPAPSFREKLKIHKFKIIGGILGILVFVGAVFGAYKFGQRQIQPATQPTPTPEVVATPTPDPTADWKTYTNTKYGYSIKYPNDWMINRGPGNVSDAELVKQRGIDFYSLETALSDVSLIIDTNELHPTGEEANCQTLEGCISGVSQTFPGEVSSSETQNITFLGESAVVKIYDRTTESYIQTNYHLFFLKNGDFYHLHFYSPKESYNQNKDALNLILSTFRFLEEEVSIESQEECESSGGEWAYHRAHPLDPEFAYCVLPTSNAGQSCTNNSQCESNLCVVKDLSATSGTCYGWSSAIGWCGLALIEENRVKSYCID